MTNQLPPEIDQRVQSQIAFGFYQTPAEALNIPFRASEIFSRSLNRTMPLVLGQLSEAPYKPNIR
ncbi:MAG TPA: hypothetical protein VHE81_03905 [Lacipirellulaceae bacterium]|nr:hypothetical protein [Lacipirellulaceae bacterium]